MSAGLLERFDIAPVVSAALTDVAAFLHRWQSNDSGNNTRVPRVKKAARENGRQFAAASEMATPG